MDRTTSRSSDSAVLRRTAQITPPHWAKYTASENRDTGVAQTNYFEGIVGETNPRLKVHIAVDEYGRLLFVRDIDGTVLFDRSRGDTPPPGWN